MAPGRYADPIKDVGFDDFSSGRENAEKAPFPSTGGLMADGHRARKVLTMACAGVATKYLSLLLSSVQPNVYAELRRFWLAQPPRACVAFARPWMGRTQS